MEPFLEATTPRHLCLGAMILVIALLTSGLMFSQATRSTVLGTVRDPSGAVVPGVEVIITNTGTNVSTPTLTNQAGLYDVPLLLPGSYEVSAELHGFKKFVRRGITLAVGSRVEINIQLEIGERAETVTVTAEEPLIQTTNASIGQVFDKRSIAELPVMGNSALLLSGLAEGMQRGSYNYLGLHSSIGGSDYRTAQHGSPQRQLRQDLKH